MRHKKISDVKVGDRVLTRDVDGNDVYRTVIDVMRTYVPFENQRKIVFTSGTELICSSNHPIMCTSNDGIVQVLPDDLTTDHIVISDKGTTDSIQVVIPYKTDTEEFVDITVDDTHTFFTKNDENSNWILTHNSGSASLYFPIWHKEIEDLLVLKNNKGTEDARARQLDYGVSINGHFYKKAIAREEYCLFNPNDYPDLYQAFFNDQDKYAELYDKYSKSRKVKKIDAFDLLNRLVDERAQTGRIYIFNVDTVNHQSAFKSVVYSSNLCLEIALPTQNLTKLGTFPTKEAKTLGIYAGESMEEFRAKFGEIALCTLSAINWGNIKKPSDFEKPARLAVRALDNLLDYQDYPVIAAEIPGRARRSLGVGIINLAHFLAKNGLKYGEPQALELVDEYMEAMYFYLMKATVELAKERGACDWNTDTYYSDGEFVWEKRAKAVDSIIPHTPRLDWESLREDMKTYGVRHSTVIAMMPSETSAVISNATNGVEPPRAAITVKSNKDSVVKQLVPNPRLKYDYLWDQPTPDGYLKTMAVLQKYTDQAISANTSYNPANFDGGKVPMSQLLRDLLNAYKYGLKTLYYHNTAVDVKGADEGDCESCKI